MAKNRSALTPQISAFGKMVLPCLLTLLILTISLSDSQATMELREPSFSFSENSMGFFSRAAPGIITGGFQANRFIEKPDEFEDNLIYRQKLKSTRTWSRLRGQDYYPVAWQFGAEYAHLESAQTSLDPPIIDNQVGIRGGFWWEMTPYVSSRISTSLNMIPEESYGSALGIFEFQLTVPILDNKARDRPSMGNARGENSFHDAALFNSHEQVTSPSEKDDDEVFDDESSYSDLETYNPSEAQQYYRAKLERRRKQKVVVEKDHDLEFEVGDEEDDEPSFDRWVRHHRFKAPFLRMGWMMGFGYHLIQEKVLRGASLGGATVGGQSMNQYFFGASLEYYKIPNFIIRVRGMGFVYNMSVNQFVSGLQMDAFRRQPISGQMDLSVASNQVLSFPAASWDESFEWTLGYQDRLVFNFNQSIYASSSQPPTFTFQPMVYHTYQNDWELGLGGLFALGGVSPPLVSAFIQLSYPLVD